MANKSITFLLDEKYNKILDEYCDESYIGTKSLFIRQAIIDKMKDLQLIQSK